MADPIEKGGQKSRTSEKVAEMTGFIEMGDFPAGVDFHWARGESPQDAEPCAKEYQPEQSMAEG